MPGPWSRSSEGAEVVATRRRMAKAAERAGLMGAWVGAEFCTDRAEFCTGIVVESLELGLGLGLRPLRGERGPVDLVKVLTGVELEVAGELRAGEAGFAF